MRRALFSEPKLGGWRRTVQLSLSWILILAGCLTALSCFGTETRDAATEGWSFDGVDLGGGSPAGSWHSDVIGVLLLVGAAALAFWGRRGGGRALVAGLANLALSLLAAGSNWLARHPIGIVPVESRGSSVPLVIGVTVMCALGVGVIIASFVLPRAERRDVESGSQRATRSASDHAGGNGARRRRRR